MHIMMLHQYFSVEGKAPQARFYQLGRRLVENGHQVTVLTGNSHLGLPLGRKKIGLLQQDGLAVVVFNLNYSPTMKLSQKRRAFLAFARLAARQGRCLPRPDLLLASSPPLTVALPALFLSRRHHIPLVLEVRELWPDAVIHRRTLRSKVLIKLARRLEEKAYRQAARIIVPGPGIASAVAAQTGEGKVTVLPDHLDGDELYRQFSKLL